MLFPDLAPPPPQDPSPLRGTPGSSLRSPAEGEGGSAPDFLEAGCDSDRRIPVEFAQESQARILEYSAA